MSEALNWATRITTIGLMMVLPALGGRWLDGRYGTNYWSLVGLVFGLAIGLLQLVQIAREGTPQRSVKNQNHPSSGSRPGDSELKP